MPIRVCSQRRSVLGVRSIGGHGVMLSLTPLALALVAGCAGPADGPAGASADAGAVAGGPAPRTLPAAEVPAPGKTVRVGGDTEVRAERRGDYFFSGTASITTELPDGYPDPTPPGAIDIKSYPSIRRAEISGTTSPDVGMNTGFFPLFGHISRRKIAMTSPVEVDYAGWNWQADAAGSAAAPPPPAQPAATRPRSPRPRPESWTMSFLYRRPDLGPVGTDEANEQIKIVDTAPVTVLAVGWQGDYSMRGTADALAVLEKWLSENRQWEIAGPPRSLYYNGPEKRARERWAEAQLPIRPAGSAK